MEVTYVEVEKAIMSGDPWKALDSHGVEIGFVRHAWPIIGPCIRAIFQSSVCLGFEPTHFKASNAIPTFKHGKTDKTAVKSWRPVEQHAEVLARPLERIVANRISFEVGSLGLVSESRSGADQDKAPYKRWMHLCTRLVAGWMKAWLSLHCSWT